MVETRKHRTKAVALGVHETQNCVEEKTAPPASFERGKS